MCHATKVQTLREAKRAIKKHYPTASGFKEFESDGNKGVLFLERPYFEVLSFLPYGSSVEEVQEVPYD